MLKSSLLRMRNLALIAKSQKTKLTTIQKIERENMNKKLLAGLLVIPLVFGLSACGSEESTPVTSEPYVAPQDTDTNPSDEYGYIAGIHSVGNPVLETGTRSELLEMGYNVCNALDSGETVRSIATMIQETQDTQNGREGGYAVIAAAVVYLCPEYKYQADNL